MKRLNNLYQQICSTENLLQAETKAIRGKRKQFGVKLHLQQRELNLQELQRLLITKTFKTSKYTTFKVYEPKEREVYRLPFFPDRIAHHAIMNVLEPVFISAFTADTYSCIKKRGVHAAHRAIKKALLDVEGTTYCLQLDIKKFYPNVDHAILKQLLRRKFKDKDLLWFLDEIIDSAPGLPIGNYLSQYLANFYLTPFDHWIKEVKRRRYYFRYADDLILFGATKEELHALLHEIKSYLKDNLNLELKGNYQVFKVEDRGVDVLGYKYFHTHVLLRKRNKQKMARAIARNKPASTIASYLGQAKHANTKTLINKLLYGRKTCGKKI
ncbi:MAG TPA: reverse transcriptase domain-containing protein [Bacteroidia bacterium]|nr:reverse transcriptase domain-containing protein [Bacteroidia bacterium]